MMVHINLAKNISSDVFEYAWEHHLQGLGALVDLRSERLMEGCGSDLLEIFCCQMVSP
jgi:hypothetical protein